MNWKELEGVDRDLNEVLSPDLPGVIEESHEKSVKTKDISSEIRSTSFSDTGLEPYCYADRCGFVSF